MVIKALGKVSIFNGFSGLYPQLKALLDKVRAAGKDSASVYSDASSGKFDYGKWPDGPNKGKVKTGADGKPSDVKVIEKGSRTIVQDYVATLSAEQISYLSGLKFTAPGDDKKSRTDVVNSILTAWDKAASKYMKQENSAGDANVPALKNRLAEFDTAIRTKGKTPVKPDT